jgi:hypothetical protein
MNVHVDSTHGRRLCLTALAAAAIAVSAAPVTYAGQDSSAEALSSKVFTETHNVRVCSPGERPDGSLSAAKPSPALASLLARIGGKPASSRDEQALTLAAGGDVLKASLRSVRFPGGNELLVFGWTGTGGLMARDPAACKAARLKRLEIDHPADDATRTAAAAILSGADDTNTALQWIVAARLRDGKVQGQGSIRIVGDKPAIGIWGGQSATGAGTYLYGMAPSGAARVQVTRTGSSPATVHVAVRSGLFAFSMRTASGSLTVRYLSASGKVLGAVQKYRSNGARA